MYEGTAKPMVSVLMTGFNVTIFAYGQTSSGKTFTMQGPDFHHPELKGITPRLIEDVFETMANDTSPTEYTIKVSIVEIYMERIRDLQDISKTHLKIRENAANGIYIDDVTEVYAASADEVFDCMDKAYANRAVGHTNMNEGSSRSHLIFLMHLFQKDPQNHSAKRSKLFLIDLAGSEKISKTGAQGERLEEAKKINKSLSCLGNVINALTDGKSSHIPYRNSVLTRMLQDSIGGNSKTTLIITCSPSEYNLAETMSTLLFGERAKRIKNMAKINRELTVGELMNQLEKAQKKIAVCERKIKLLEDYFKLKGLELPSYAGLDEEEKVVTGIEKKDGDKSTAKDDEEDDISISDEDDDDGELQGMGKSEIKENLIMHMQHNEKQAEHFEKMIEMYEERLKLLERELMIQTKNQHNQGEKMKQYRIELMELKNINMNREKENENLVKKMADLTVKNRIMLQTEEPLKKRIEQLETLNKTITSQIEDLKKSRAQTKRENNDLMPMVQKTSEPSVLPEGLFELLTEMAENKTIGISYSLKIKNHLQGLEAPVSKKNKGKDMNFLQSISSLKHAIQGSTTLNDKMLTAALDNLKNSDLDNIAVQSLNLIFTKLSSTPLGEVSKEKTGNTTSYRPEPEKFENTSVIQMKYEDLKKSSENEIQRLNNHIKLLSEKFEGIKDKKSGEKASKFSDVLVEKDKKIKELQEQLLLQKEKVNQLTSMSMKNKEIEEDSTTMSEKKQSEPNSTMGAKPKLVQKASLELEDEIAGENEDNLINNEETMMGDKYISMSKISGGNSATNSMKRTGTGIEDHADTPKTAKIIKPVARNVQKTVIKNTK